MPTGDFNKTLAEAVIKRQSELSFLAPQSFLMVIERLPTTTYFIQTITIPTASAGEAQFTNPHNAQTFIPGDTVDYVPLDVQYLVDSKMDSYRTIYEWMLGTANPQGFEQFVDYTTDVASGQSDFQKLTSDIYVYATDPSGKPIAQWTFKNAFPISLDGPQFDATRPDVEYLVTTASFRYMYYEFKSLSPSVDPNSFIGRQNDKVLIELTFDSNLLAPLSNATADVQLLQGLDVTIPFQNWNNANSLSEISTLFRNAYNISSNTGEANSIDSTIVISRSTTDSSLGLTEGVNTTQFGIVPTITTTAANLL